MTKLEKMLTECCERHKGDPCYDEFDYDPTEGHYHIEPPTPEFMDDVTFSDNPPEIYWGDASYTIEQLIELRDWLNIVLSNADKTDESFVPASWKLESGPDAQDQGIKEEKK